MNILLLNGGKQFGHSQGRLNQTLHDHAHSVLVSYGHVVQATIIDQGYDVEQEVEKFLWMDAVIWQMPGWWMGEPWTVKEYIDKVFTAGTGRLYASDGRHREAPTEGYGTGGLLQGKKHMLSLTWNAPIEAFTRPGDFFEGRGVDPVRTKSRSTTNERMVTDEIVGRAGWFNPPGSDNGCQIDCRPGH